MNNWEKLTLKIDQSDFLKGVAISLCCWDI